MLSPHNISVLRLALATPFNPETGNSHISLESEQLFATIGYEETHHDQPPVLAPPLRTLFRKYKFPAHIHVIPLCSPFVISMCCLWCQAGTSSMLHLYAVQHLAPTYIFNSDCGSNCKCQAAVTVLSSTNRWFCDGHWHPGHFGVAISHLPSLLPNYAVPERLVQCSRV